MPSLPPPRPRPRSFGGSGSFAPTLGRAPRPGSRSSHHKRPWRDTQSSGRGGAFAPTPSRGLRPWSTASSPSGPTTLCYSGASAAGVQGAAPPGTNSSLPPISSASHHPFPLRPLITPSFQICELLGARWRGGLPARAPVHAWT
jgi:hypothetical protein